MKVLPTFLACMLLAVGLRAQKVPQIEKDFELLSVQGIEQLDSLLKAGTKHLWEKVVPNKRLFQNIVDQHFFVELSFPKKGGDYTFAVIKVKGVRSEGNDLPFNTEIRLIGVQGKWYVSGKNTLYATRTLPSVLDNLLKIFKSDPDVDWDYLYWVLM